MAAAEAEAAAEAVAAAEAAAVARSRSCSRRSLFRTPVEEAWAPSIPPVYVSWITRIRAPDASSGNAFSRDRRD